MPFHKMPESAEDVVKRSTGAEPTPTVRRIFSAAEEMRIRVGGAFRTTDIIKMILLSMLADDGMNVFPKMPPDPIPVEEDLLAAALNE